MGDYSIAPVEPGAAIGHEQTAGGGPGRRILKGAARVVLGAPVEMDKVDREAAREKLKAVKTKVIHAGREGVEREVPVLPKKFRSRKAVVPGDVVDGGKQGTPES